MKLAKTPLIWTLPNLLRVYLATLLLLLIFLAGSEAQAMGKNHTDNLLPNDNVSWSNNGTTQGYIFLEKADASDQLALTVTTKVVAPWDFYPQISLPVAGPLKHGDFAHLRFRGRSENGLFLDVDIQHNASPWQTVGSRTVIFSSQWKDYDLVYQIDRDVPAGWANLTLHVPRKLGRFEIAGITLENIGKNKAHLQDSKLIDDYYAGAKTMPEWWQEADRRIELTRKRPLKITVRDKQNKPVVGATVILKQTAHLFKFGTAIDSSLILDAENDGQYRTAITDNFNSVVPENALKWAMQDNQDPASPALLVQWCKRKQLNIRGHCLLWPSYRHLPESLRSERGPVLREAIRQHITSYVKTFSPNIYEWDVVNEALTNTDIQKELGDQILVDAFNWARESNNHVSLAYNDYDILNVRAGANDGKRAAVKELITRLLGSGAPIDVLGIQSHMHKGAWSAEKLWTTCETYARFGVPLHFTELTVVSGHLKEPEDNDWHRRHMDWVTTPEGEARQLEEGRRFYTLLFSHPAVDAVTWWDFSDREAWQGAPAGLLRKDMSPKPLADWLRQAFHETWTTRSVTRADNEGVVTFRGFFGTYAVRVETDSGLCLVGTCRLSRRQAPVVADVAVA